MFDPSWFTATAPSLFDRLTRQARARRGCKLRLATEAYAGFVAAGGRVRFADLELALLHQTQVLGIG